MNLPNVFQLTESLSEIRRLTTILLPLLDEGQEAASEFCSELDAILENIFPVCNVAIAGPVGSGKSTLLSSLLKESGRHPIASISPSNETFAPMSICYGKQASLVVQYFSIDVIKQIDEFLADAEKSGAPHQIAQYRDLRNRLRSIEAVRAGRDQDHEIVRKIDLQGLTRSELSRTLKSYIAHSSENNDVYGIYRAELTYPGDVVQELRNIRFIDLYGFGEPSPLINIKYTRFIDEDDIDAIIYVLPDRSITEDFNRLFEIPGLLDNIIANRRLFLVLNKADAYTDKGPRQWNTVIKEFRQALAYHVPILKKYIDNISIYTLSTASIDGSIQHVNREEVREKLLISLYGLRDELRRLSSELDESSSDPSIYLGTLFDLLSGLDDLSETVELTLEDIEEKLSSISKLVDGMSQRHYDFMTLKPKVTLVSNRSVKCSSMNLTVT